MRRYMFWIGLGVVAAGFLGARPAYAPLVTVPEKKEAPGKTPSGGSEVVDLSDVEDAGDQPTWSPSFENQQDGPADDEE